MEQHQHDLFQHPRSPLPNGVTVFVLGVCSILFLCFFIGFVLGIIGLAMAREPRAMYRDNPTLYEGYGLLNAGFILSIIGTSLGGLYVAYFAIIGLIAMNM